MHDRFPILCEDNYQILSDETGDFSPGDMELYLWYSENVLDEAVVQESLATGDLPDYGKIFQFYHRYDTDYLGTSLDLDEVDGDDAIDEASDDGDDWFDLAGPENPEDLIKFKTSSVKEKTIYPVFKTQMTRQYLEVKKIVTTEDLIESENRVEELEFESTCSLQKEKKRKRAEKLFLNDFYCSSKKKKMKIDNRLSKIQSKSYLENFLSQGGLPVNRLQKASYEYGVLNDCFSDEQLDLIFWALIKDRDKLDEVILIEKGKLPVFLKEIEPTLVESMEESFKKTNEEVLEIERKEEILTLQGREALVGGLSNNQLERLVLKDAFNTSNKFAKHEKMARAIETQFLSKFTDKMPETVMMDYWKTRSSFLIASRKWYYAKKLLDLNPEWIGRVETRMFRFWSCYRVFERRLCGLFAYHGLEKPFELLNREIEMTRENNNLYPWMMKPDRIIRTDKAPYNSA